MALEKSGNMTARKLSINEKIIKFGIIGLCNIPLFDLTESQPFFMHNNPDDYYSNMYRQQSEESIDEDNSPSDCDSRQITSSQSLSSSSAVKNDTKCMNDFVIIHTDEDLGKATECMEAIIEDLKEEGATVHLFSEIGHGKTLFQIIELLHEQYRYILVYAGESLENDNTCKFSTEILIMAGLNGNENKEYRVVPIFTKKSSSGSLALDAITGIKYYQRNRCKRRHIGVLQKLLKSARERFPC